MIRHPYHAAEWPEGLRCATCSRLFREGQSYREVPESVCDNGCLVVLIVCTRRRCA